MSTVSLRDFDLGVVMTLGAQLVPVKVDNDVRNEHAIDCRPYVVGPDQTGGLIPVFFLVGRSPYSPKIFPCITVKMTSLDHAPENGGHGFGIEYERRAKHSGTVDVEFGAGDSAETVTGPTHLERLDRAVPYNIAYDITVKARGDSASRECNELLAYVLSVFPSPGSSVTVVDSVGDERTYTVLTESISPNTSALDLSERDSAYVVGIKIQGELNHGKPEVAPTVKARPVVTVSVK